MSLFLTSKAVLNFFHEKQSTRVASLIPERLKIEDLRKWENIRKKSKLSVDRFLCPAVPPQKELLQ